MQEKSFSKLAQPLYIAPLFDSQMLNDWQKEHRNYDEASRAADKFIRRYLASREFEFQRNNLAVTM